MELDSVNNKQKRCTIVVNSLFNKQRCIEVQRDSTLTLLQWDIAKLLDIEHDKIQLYHYDNRDNNWECNIVSPGLKITTNMCIMVLRKYNIT